MYTFERLFYVANVKRLTKVLFILAIVAGIWIMMPAVFSHAEESDPQPDYVAGATDPENQNTSFNDSTADNGDNRTEKTENGTGTDETTTQQDPENSSAKAAPTAEGPAGDPDVSDPAIKGPAGPEARIGDKTYDKLQDAVDDAKDDDKVEILKDIELEKTVIIKNKSITVSDDGNARTISGKNGTVNSLFRVEKNAALTLDGTSVEKLKLQGGACTTSYSATCVMVYGTLNIKKVTIDGGKINGYYIGVIHASDGGHINMSDGVIENTISGESYTYSCAPVLIRDGGHFDLSGGVIRNNKCLYGKASSSSTYRNGGGVTVLSTSSTNPATMHMSGGRITGNEAHHGGGIYTEGTARIHMTGGSIDNNTARRIGGGVCVAGLGGEKYNEFVMDGGSVSYNRSANGGGFYVNSDRVFLNAGYIENNVVKYINGDTSTGHGGGVYVSAVPRVLYINKAVITDNQAVSYSFFISGTSGLGGGLWACPTGTINLLVTDGVAIYGNQAVGSSTAGDDVVKVSLGYNSYITLPDRMLGGGQVIWHKDGGVYNGSVGSANSSIPRFDPDNPGDPIVFNNQYNSVAAKAIVSDEAIARANKEATLFIRGNIANHGGGIGTNGDLTLKSMDYKEWQLIVEKKWEDIPEEEWKDVQVFLKIGDEILDSVTLGRENNWKAVFTGLPDPSSLNGEISVVEGEFVELADGTIGFCETDRYDVSYKKAIDEDEYTICLTVINRPIPEIPPEIPPETPSDEKTEVLGAYEEPISHRAIKKRMMGVASGDSGYAACWLLILLAAGLVFITRRRRNAR